MYYKMTDKDFLSQVNLKKKKYTEASILYSNKKYNKAALKVADLMFSSPFQNPVDELEIPALKEILLNEHSDEITYLIKFSDNYLLKNKKVKNVSKEEESLHYSDFVKFPKERGVSSFLLARLFHLTGKKKYLEASIRYLKSAVKNYPVFEDGLGAKAYFWHPSKSIGANQNPAHLGQELCLTLPFIREHIDAETKLWISKLLLSIGKLGYDSVRNDYMFNLPLHYLSASHVVSISFPDFKDANIWRKWAQKRISDNFSTLPCVTKDGYFREGLSYQEVNHALMILNYTFWKATKVPVDRRLEKITIKSFEFATKLLRNDGWRPIVADSNLHKGHEPFIMAKEMLHLAAGVFNRKDFKEKAGDFSNDKPLEYMVWQMGLKAYDNWKHFKVSPKEKLEQNPVDFSESGYQILGTGKGLDAHYTLLSYNSDINHAHNDAMSLDITGFGRTLLTDPGFSGYGSNYDKDTIEAVHNKIKVSRFSPLGPRLESNKHLKTLQVSHSKNVQLVGVSDALYESHLLKRSIAMITPSSEIKKAAPQVFYILLDQVHRKHSYPNKKVSEPYELVETFFHFDAPDTDLGVDKSGLTCWSKFDPKKALLNRFGINDVMMVGESEKVDYAERMAAQRVKVSNANLQLTALVPDKKDYHCDLALGKSFTFQYGGRVQRPMVNFMFNGSLPYTAAYVLIPFKGVRKNAFAKIDYKYKGEGGLDLTVVFGKNKCDVEVKRLLSDRPQVILKK